MLRDLDKELSAFARQRQQKRAAGGGTAPKSLWEELYDIGEEFVDFLEQVRKRRKVFLSLLSCLEELCDMGEEFVDFLEQVGQCSVLFCAGVLF